MSLRFREILNFKSVGVEISATKVSADDSEECWRFGYGFFGSVELEGILGTASHLDCMYRLSKTEDVYRLSMRLEGNDWRGVFGIEKLIVQLETSFSSKSPEESLSIRISAAMTLRNAQVILSGQYSQAESFLEAELGGLSWREICDLYAELTGQTVTVNTDGNDLRFENLCLRFSSKGIMINGNISFNEHRCATGLVSLGSNGLQITGGIESFTIPDTGIQVEEAALDIFVGRSVKDGKGGKAVRASRFSVRGTVEFSGRKVSIGFHTSSGAPGHGRQWMLYASLESDLKLSKIAKELEGTDMDISLRKAAIVASNIDAANGSSTDMNSQVNPLDYPVSKGLTFCALIEPLSAINKLNKDQTVDGLMLVASYDFGGKLSIAIRLPSAMTIEFGQTASLGNFKVAVEISKQSKLILDGDLSLKMKDQAPLNPSGLSDKVEINYLAVDLELIYATVFVSGPSKLGLAGTVTVGEIEGSAAMSVSQMPDQQLLSVDISKINVAEIIKFAGKLADSKSLQDTQGGDFLIFLDASMYVSTGATVAGKEYPAGISASGTMILFGKTAKFSAAFGETGVRFAGSVNAFNIGPLEVKSASGAPDASMEIVMMTGEQKIFVDGMIKILALEAKININVSLQPLVAFDVDVDIRFGDAFKFVLQAKASNVSDLKDLAKADLDFRAELSGDIFGLICDSVVNVLGKIEELGDEGFQAIDKQLRGEIDQIDQQLQSTSRQVEEAKGQTESERSRRGKILENEEAKPKKAQAELHLLENKVQQAKDKQDADIQAARDQLQEAELHREIAIRNKRAEYDDKLRKAQDEQQKIQREQNELNRQMTDKYGPIRVMQRNKDGQLQKYTVQQAVVNELRRDLARWEQDYRTSNAFRKPGVWFEVNKRKAVIAAADFTLGQLGDAWNAINAKLNDAGFKSLDETIIRGADDLSKVGRGLQALQTQGVGGFIRAVEHDEDKRVADRQRELRVMENGNQKHMDAIREAQAQLDSRRPDLESIIARADEKILRTQEDKQLSVLEVQYGIELENEARVKQQIQQVQASLTLLHKDFKGAVQDMKATVEKLKSTMFRITRIVVKVNAKDLKEGRPMMFEVEGKVGDQNVGPLTIEWSPLETPADLYRRIARKAIAL
ncbi:MAG: hypothetical protein Q9218_005496 [Villophora microphyllina]